VALVIVIIVIRTGRAMILPGKDALDDTIDDAYQVQLKTIAESIYEYRIATGKWPTHAEDLTKTSLAVQAPLILKMVQDEYFVVNWRDDWKPNPRENGGRILVWAKSGRPRMGWVWVCWGDMRMEYMHQDRVAAILRENKDEN
jgi:hypothetical protein